MIVANLQAAGFVRQATVHARRVERALDRLGRCRLLLMDPPYTQPFPSRVIAAIGGAGLLEERGVLVCGHASRVPADDRCGVLTKWDDRRYGDASLAFYGREDEVAA